MKNNCYDENKIKIKIYYLNNQIKVHSHKHKHMGAVLSISGWALATDEFLQIHPASGNEPLRSTTSEANLTVDDLQQRLE